MLIPCLFVLQGFHVINVTETSSSTEAATDLTEGTRWLSQRSLAI